MILSYLLILYLNKIHNNLKMIFYYLIHFILFFYFKINSNFFKMQQLHYLKDSIIHIIILLFLIHNNFLYLNYFHQLIYNY